MRSKINYKRVFLYLLVTGLLSLSGFAQPTKSIELLIPMSDVNQKISKVRKQIMGIESFVNVGIIADINDYNACSDESISAGGVSLKISWYNTNDETGKYMVSTLKDLNGINQEMNSFKNESGFNVNEAKEEDYQGGKLWIITKQKECVNEITGPTGKTEYFTHLRFFVFNGTAMIKIELKGFSKSVKMKEMLGKMIQEANKFDYSTLTNIVVTE